MQTENWGRVGANGVLFISDGQGLLVDTPWNEAQTESLITWIEKNLNVQVITFVPGHWHEDCVGGLAWLHRHGVDSWANEMTVQETRSRNLPVPHHGFSGQQILPLGNREVLCFYPGPGHAMDNIVVWFPAGKTLFGGCLIKDLNSNNLGNTHDGDVPRYTATVQKVIDLFGSATRIVPGHGKPGRADLLQHTKELAEKAAAGHP